MCFLCAPCDCRREIGEVLHVNCVVAALINLVEEIVINASFVFSTMQLK
jgi:hypothetical protein